MKGDVKDWVETGHQEGTLQDLNFYIIQVQNEHTNRTNHHTPELSAARLNFLILLNAKFFSIEAQKLAQNWLFIVKNYM